MSVDVLRQAAALMRERAEAVNYPSPWQIGGGTCGIRCNEGRNYVASTYGGVGTEEAAAIHIASWHPAVALAVADLLDIVEAGWEDYDPDGPGETSMHFVCAWATNLARAYLGDPA